MNTNSENFVKELIEKSNKINSSAFNLTRLIILALTAYNKDGFQYRELKALLNISDGKLKSNLDSLQEMEYINKVKIVLDQKKMHIYMISELGERELKKIKSWIEIMNKLEG